MLQKDNIKIFLWSSILIGSALAYASGFVLKLPYKSALNFVVTQGYSGDGVSDPNQVTHKAGGKDQYALDMTMNGCAAYDKDVLATSDGIVRIIKTEDQSGGYGNMIDVDHGSNLISRYAHLIAGSVLLKQGDTIKTGQLLGKIGNSGLKGGIACLEYPGTHLHFAMYQKQSDGSFVAYKPEPISGYTELAAGDWYISDNTLYDPTALVQNEPQRGGWFSAIVSATTNFLSGTKSLIVNAWDSLFGSPTHTTNQNATTTAQTAPVAPTSTQTSQNETTNPISAQLASTYIILAKNDPATGQNKEVVVTHPDQSHNATTTKVVYAGGGSSGPTTLPPQSNSPTLVETGQSSSGGGPTPVPTSTTSSTIPIPPPTIFEPYEGTIYSQPLSTQNNETGGQWNTHSFAQTFVPNRSGIVNQLNIAWSGRIDGANDCSVKLYQTDDPSKAGDANFVGSAYWGDPSSMTMSGGACVGGGYTITSSTIIAGVPYTMIFKYSNATNYPYVRGAPDSIYGMYWIDGREFPVEDLSFTLSGTVTSPTSTITQTLNAPPGFALSFDAFTSLAGLSWLPFTDLHTSESQVLYQINISTGGILNDANWQTLGPNVFSTTTAVTFPNSYTLGVRATDGFGNASPASVINWSFRAGYIPFIVSSQRYVAGVQDFVVPRAGSLGSIQAFLTNFDTRNGNQPSTCSMNVFDLTDGSVVSSDNDYLDTGCPQHPTFTFSSHPVLDPTHQYEWRLTMSSFWSASYWGHDTNMVGGLFSDSIVKNAAFILNGTDGVLLDTAVGAE